MMLWSEDNDKPAYAAEYFPHDTPLEAEPEWLWEDFEPFVYTRQWRRLRQITGEVA